MSDRAEPLDPPARLARPIGKLGTLLAEDATCRDLLACVFDLNELERTAYLCLLGRDEHTVDDLAGHLGRDRTTAHRAAAKLVTLGLAAKENRGLPGAGYRQVLRPTPPEDVARLVRERFESVRARVERLADAFPEEARRLADEVGAAAHGRG